MSRRLTIEGAILYSEARVEAAGNTLPPKSRDLWTATLSGLVVGGLLATVLSISDLTLSTAIGAVLGGVVAAYVLYGKVGQAALAGALSGILGTPFFLGLSQILLIFEVIPLPSGPTPPMSQLQEAVVFILMTNLIAGALGGALGGAVRHPREETGVAPQVGALGTTAAQVKYCVQCGAQLPPGAVICPQCNARQPQ